MNKCEYWSERSRTAWTYDRYTGIPDEKFVKTYGTCNGTREQEQCLCGGDETQCDFYEEIRVKVMNAMNATNTKKNHICANCVGCETEPEDGHGCNGYDSFVQKENYRELCEELKSDKSAPIMLRAAAAIERLQKEISDLHRQLGV